MGAREKEWGPNMKVYRSSVYEASPNGKNIQRSTHQESIPVQIADHNSGEVLDKCIDGDDRSNGSSGRHEGGRGFSVSDHLGIVVSLGFPW